MSFISFSAAEKLFDMCEAVEMENTCTELTQNSPRRFVLAGDTWCFLYVGPCADTAYNNTNFRNEEKHFFVLIPLRSSRNKQHFGNNRSSQSGVILDSMGKVIDLQ